MNFLSGYKTYLTAAAALIAAALAFANGEASAMEAIQLGITALLAAFLRKGVKSDGAG